MGVCLKNRPNLCFSGASGCLDQTITHMREVANLESIPSPRVPATCEDANLSIDCESSSKQSNISQEVQSLQMHVYTNIFMYIYICMGCAANGDTTCDVCTYLDLANQQIYIQQIYTHDIYIYMYIYGYVVNTHIYIYIHIQAYMHICSPIHVYIHTYI